jgi:hypothetical protein
MTVPVSRWEGNGPCFHLWWGYRAWELKLDEAEPGLRWESHGSRASLFSLSQLRAAGRFSRSAFTSANLLGFELHRNRVVAAFAPPNWGDLTVRVAWGVATDNAVDLEVQASATSVAELFGLEVEVSSNWIELGGASADALTWTVEPRDACAAALSYDGREAASVLHGLTTLPFREPVGASLRPRVWTVSSRNDPDLYYAEMVHPSDVARRVIIAPAGQSASRHSYSTRYGLFGHDLEKGVVLRARLRACWIQSKSPEDDVRRRYDEFLREPLPLGP